MAREQERQLVARRSEPLPANTFLVVSARRVAALRVVGSGSAELTQDLVGRPAALGVRSVRTGRLRRRRVRLYCTDGKRVLLALAPGEYGIGEVGRSVAGALGVVDVTDALQLLVAIPVLLWRMIDFTVHLGSRTRRRSARAATARKIAAALR
jgi:hypothetical protein